jgi:5-methyltetrahydropteroyltriglutamate--homocysteine methyltransferase
VTVSSVIRAVHVGSLLRPAELLDARAEHAAGRMDDDTLRETEDNAVRVALDLQRDSGIGILTDGEYRRNDFMSHLTAATDGFVNEAPVLDWNTAEGESHKDDAILNLIGGPLRYRDRFTEVEASFLDRHAPGP